jgi:hypothetical protein
VFALFFSWSEMPNGSQHTNFEQESYAKLVFTRLSSALFSVSLTQADTVSHSQETSSSHHTPAEAGVFESELSAALQLNTKGVSFHAPRETLEDKTTSLVAIQYN